MNKTVGEEPAFSGVYHETDRYGTPSIITLPGLSKREFFAAMALQGILANGAGLSSVAAAKAVEKADELITVLNL